MAKPRLGVAKAGGQITALFRQGPLTRQAAHHGTSEGQDEYGRPDAKRRRALDHVERARSSGMKPSDRVQAHKVSAHSIQASQFEVAD